MAFFNFRLPGTKGRDDKAPAVSSDSVEVMRRRARHRLIGATVLVAIGVGDGPSDLCHNPQQNRVYTANYRGRTISVLRDSAPAPSSASSSSASGAGTAKKGPADIMECA